MSCSGYILLNRRTIAYVELCEGEMKFQAQDAIPITRIYRKTSETNVLPILLPQYMAREIATRPSLKTRKSDENLEAPRERIVRLSGHSVTVKKSLIDSTSFIVTIYKLNIMTDPKDCSLTNTKEEKESFEITCVDDKTCIEWMKQINGWNRLAWVDPIKIQASENDLSCLQVIKNKKQVDSSITKENVSLIQMKMNSEAFDEPQEDEIDEYQPQRRRRRRFYRANASAVPTQLSLLQA